MPTLTRRTLLAGSAAAVLAAGAGPAAAAAPPSGKQTSGVYRYKIGTFELTALYDGIWYRPITDKFIRNAPFAEVEHALADAFMPPDKLTTPFTTLVVNTGRKLVPSAASRPWFNVRECDFLSLDCNQGCEGDWTDIIISYAGIRSRSVGSGTRRQCSGQVDYEDNDPPAIAAFLRLDTI